jgi:hypothetical protein
LRDIEYFAFHAGLMNSILTPKVGNINLRRVLARHVEAARLRRALREICQLHLPGLAAARRAPHVDNDKNNFQKTVYRPTAF